MPIDVKLDGDEIRISVRTGGADPLRNESPGEKRIPTRVADDCTSVVWRDQRFTFTRKQRSVVQALLAARADGRDFVSQETLLQLAESDQMRLRELFRSHAAWGTMIVPGHECGGPLGTYKVCD